MYYLFFFSAPELKAQWWACRIGRPLSSVCMSVLCSQHFPTSSPQKPLDQSKMHLTKWLHEPIWISKVKVIHWPWSKVTQINIFKFLFLSNCVADWSQILCGASIRWGTKVWSNGLGHMTKMATMPIYGKNLKKYLFWNQKADDLTSWHAALGTRVLSSLFKWWPWDDLDLFYGKVKFGPLCFCMGKKVKQWIFSEIVVVYDIKVGRCSQLNEYKRSRSFLTFVQITQIQVFYTPLKLCFAWGVYCFQIVRDSEIPSTFNDFAL